MTYILLSVCSRCGTPQIKVGVTVSATFLFCLITFVKLHLLCGEVLTVCFGLEVAEFAACGRFSLRVCEMSVCEYP